MNENKLTQNNSIIYFKNNAFLLKLDGINLDKISLYIGSCLSFSVLLILISIVTYPGGLDISGEFIGNLNGIKSISNGESNTWPRILFFIATLIMSIFGMLFFIVLQRKFIALASTDFEKKLTVIGSFLGIGVIIIYSEIFLVPYDRLLLDSTITSLLIFLSIFLLQTTLLFYSYLTIKHQDILKYSSISTIIMTLISLLGGLLFLNFILDIVDIEERNLEMFLNLILISFFIWMTVLSFHLKKEFNGIITAIPIIESPALSILLKTSRLHELDSLRGLIIILMALDHANFFIAHKHPGGEYYSQLPIYSENLDGFIAFLTRFVTHLCAPGFFFLMGVGMVLFANSRRKKNWSELRIIKHFWIRGVLLIILQLFVINQIWEMQSEGFFPWPYFGVLYALGGTMILGSLLLKIPIKYLIIIGLAFVFVTEINSNASLGPLITNPTPYYPLGNTDSLVLLLLVAGGNSIIWVNYPILPWMEVLILGFIFGKVLIIDNKKAYNFALILGISFLVLFFILRLLNSYGNTYPIPTNFTLIDFFNVVKYPPSITFVLITMGINLVFLFGFSKIRGEKQKLLKPLIVFGQVALFVYILHLFLYAVMGLLLTPNGTEFVIMYPLWIIGLVILYPICKKYGQFKHTRSENSIVRFF